MPIMMRVRLKADGRLVEILPDGSERAPASQPEASQPEASNARAVTNGTLPDAAYARGVRASTKLTQAEFAARIGVPIETVRNWEQGKRSPRGPARALLRVIEKAPEVAFAVLSPVREPETTPGQMTPGQIEQR
jgi:putative transcriptional regulator